MKRILAVLILACLPSWAATLYVKSTGDNTDGTTLAKAFTTITKSLAKTCGGGASNCSTGGDVIWVAPGTYNEIVTTGLDSPVSELQVKCDLTGVNTSSAPGMCIVTPYTSGFTALASNSDTITISKNYITLRGFYVQGPVARSKKALVLASGVTNITIDRCALIGMYGTGVLGMAITGNNSILVQNSILWGSFVTVTVAKSAVADYNSGLIFRNNIFLGGIGYSASGASTYLGGPGKVENCYFVGWGASGDVMSFSDVSTTFPLLATGNVYTGLAYNYPLLSTTGQYIDDWSNVNNNLSTYSYTGANTLMYPQLFDLGASMLFGLQPKFPFSPLSQSPLLALGTYSADGSVPGTVANDATVGTIDWDAATLTKVSQRDTVMNFVTLNHGVDSHYLKATNFGFAIPGGATIKSILVSFSKSSPTASAIKDKYVQLVDATGAIVAANKADTTNFWGTSDVFTNSYYGNTAGGDLWGAAWTPANINDADFGVVIGVTNAHASTDSVVANIDVVRVTVYYTSNTTTDIFSVTRPATLTPGPTEYKQFQRGGNSAHGN